jgi:hypothetical protein
VPAASILTGARARLASSTSAVLPGAADAAPPARSRARPRHIEDSNLKLKAAIFSAPSVLWLLEEIPDLNLDSCRCRPNVHNVDKIAEKYEMFDVS